MSLRLHVAKKFDVDYGSAENYPWMIEEFHDFLSVMGCSFTGETFDTEFEVDADEFSLMINTLKDFNSLDSEWLDEIKESMSNLYDEVYSEELLNKCIKDLESYYQEYDKNNIFLHFQFI